MLTRPELPWEATQRAGPVDLPRRYVPSHGLSADNIRTPHPQYLPPSWRGENMTVSACGELDFSWDFLGDVDLKLGSSADPRPSTSESLDPLSPALSDADGGREFEYLREHSTSSASSDSTIDTSTSDIMDDIESSPWVVSLRQFPSVLSDDIACGTGGADLCFDSVCAADEPDRPVSEPTLRAGSDSSAPPLTPDTPASVAANSPRVSSAQSCGLRGFPGTVAPGRGAVPKKRGRKPTEGRCCMVPSCNQPLSRDNMYYFRRRMCESCIRKPSVLVNGREMRFCQQCSLAHPIDAFDTNKRSCRAKLKAHKARAHDKKVEPSSPTKRSKRAHSASKALPAIPTSSGQLTESSDLPATRETLPVAQLLDSPSMGDLMDLDLTLPNGVSDNVDILYTTEDPSTVELFKS